MAKREDLGSGGLARTAANVVAMHLAQVNGHDPNADRIYRLVADRLRGTAAGVDLARGMPLDGQAHARLTHAVAAELARDGRFADALHQNIHGDFSGNHVGRDMNVKKTTKISTGGLVTGVVAIVLALGGGTAAVIANSGTPVALGAAVGTWEQAASSPMQGFEMKPTVLTITDDGRFTFSMGIGINAPDMQQLGVPQINLECAGSVTPDGDHFTLRSTTGTCGTFSAKPGPGGQVMDVFLQAGEADGSVPLSKVNR